MRISWPVEAAMCETVEEGAEIVRDRREGEEILGDCSREEERSKQRGMGGTKAMLAQDECVSPPSTTCKVCRTTLASSWANEKGSVVFDNE